MKRQLIALGLSMMMLGGTVGAQELPALHINGEASSGVAYVENGVTYVSLRSVSERLDADVRVDWEKGQAVVRSDQMELYAVPGQQWLTSNGRCLYIPGGVTLREGRTLVPIRALAEAFGAEVSWDGESNTILVDTVQEPPGAEYDEDALYWLSRIISAESRGESLKGQIAVGNVVLNRLASEGFGGQNTVYDVIFAKNEFDVVVNGMIYMEPGEDAVVAAKLALEGYDVCAGATCFHDRELGEGYECTAWIGDRCFMTKA